MMHAQGLSQAYWVEVVLIATYLSNCNSTTTVSSMTPKDTLIEQEPTVSHLHTFEYMTYMNVPQDQRQKFDDKSQMHLYQICLWQQSLQII